MLCFPFLHFSLAHLLFTENSIIHRFYFLFNQQLLYRYNLYASFQIRATCHRCGRKGRKRSWSYRSTCNKYNLHVACVKEMLVDSWHEIYFGHGDNNYRKLDNRIPSLRGTLQTHHKKSKGKAQKCCEMAGLALQFIISAVLGDPTTLIAGVVASLMSK